MANSLPIPDAATRDPKAANIASLWIAEGNLHCNINVGMFEGHPNVTETQAWGMILADFARTVAQALVADGSVQESREDTINRIWTAFHEDMSNPATGR